MADGILVKQLNAWFGAAHVLRDIDLAIPAAGVTAIIGLSGCGTSTFIRCLNRMHEVVPGARVAGTVLLDGEDAYAQDPVQFRRRVGMVFQRANPFPTMSVFENAVAGVRLAGVWSRSQLQETAERALRQAALWDEVKDQLGTSGASLSGGQQQRLCIARALAVEPSVLLPPPIVPLAGEGSLSCESGRTEYKARQRPALDDERQSEPAPEIAQYAVKRARKPPSLRALPA